MPHRATLPQLIRTLRQPGKVSDFIMFGRILSYQLVAFYQGKSNLVSGIHGITNFIFNKGIFDYIGERESS
jgi:hypothetical protein